MCAEHRAYRQLLRTPGDADLAELAFLQHGVVSTSQLRELDLDASAVHRRVKARSLHPLYRGVYAVGHGRLDWHGRLWAAVLATCSAVSHRSAAPLWEVLPIPGGRIEVTTLGHSHSTSKIHVHRSRTLRPEDIVAIDGLPVTSPTRTLQDLAQVLPAHCLKRALHNAEHRRILDAAELAAPLPGRRSKALRRGLNQLAKTEPQLTKSAIEDAMLAIVDRAGLPHPEVNARLLGYVPDFLWRDARLVVETDGRATHMTLTAFESDRARDAKFVLAGYRVIRFTWLQLTEEPDTVAATLAALLR